MLTLPLFIFNTLDEMGMSGNVSYLFLDALLNYIFPIPKSCCLPLVLISLISVFGNSASFDNYFVV